MKKISPDKDKSSSKSSETDESSIEQTILACLKVEKTPLTKAQLAKKFGLKGEQKLLLKRALRRLVENYKIIKDFHRHYTLPDYQPHIFIAEAYRVDEEGELIFRPVSLAEDTEIHKRILKQLPQQERQKTNPVSVETRLYERVLVSLVHMDEENAGIQILKKLPHESKKVLCSVQKEGKKQILVPIGRGKRLKPYTLEKTAISSLQDREIILCEPISGYLHGLKKARILKRLGQEDSPETLSLITLQNQNIITEFSKEAIEESETLTPILPDGRTDLRKYPFITIDPLDAKDHDDAVWAQQDSSRDNLEGYRVIVAIADVSSYVQANGALDKEARRRGFSVYLPNQVIPMLPEKLSNNLCSLRENEDRPCLAVEMRFTKEGKKIDHHFMRALMRSHAKLSYEQAQKAYENPNSSSHQYVFPLFNAYRTLQKERSLRSPLDINSQEVCISYASSTQKITIQKVKRLMAHRVIEDFMIQANVSAAQSLRKARIALYRIHPCPSREKISALADFLPLMKLKWSKGEKVSCKRFNQLLQKAKTLNIEETIQESVLRAQSPAQYQPGNIGHFGLNLSEYVHFTSPIRRYADLVTHRALILHLGLGSDKEKQACSSFSLNHEALSQNLNHLEKQAVMAEREANDRYMSFYLKDKIDNVFEGMIVSVTNFGLFIRLSAFGCDGFIPVRKLGNSYFTFDPKKHTLTAQGRKVCYQTGQKVTVSIMEANALNRSLILNIIDRKSSSSKTQLRRK